MLVDKRNADRRRDWKTAGHTLWLQAYVVSGSAQPCPLADCGEGRKRGKIAEKKRKTVKKAIENQLTVGFLSLFLPIKGLSIHPGVKTLPPEEERAGAYYLGIGGKRLAVEG